MSVKVAINGFGRIGRLAFRQMFGAEGYEAVRQAESAKTSSLFLLMMKQVLSLLTVRP